jgi:hypothetical protein
MNNQPCQVPLIERLRSVPPEAHQMIEVGHCAHRSIPYGSLCHEAADALERKEKAGLYAAQDDAWGLLGIIADADLRQKVMDTLRPACREYSDVQEIARLKRDFDSCCAALELANKAMNANRPETEVASAGTERTGLQQRLEQAVRILVPVADSFVIMARVGDRDGKSDSYQRKCHGTTSEQRGLVEVLRTILDENDRLAFRRALEREGE